MGCLIGTRHYSQARAKRVIDWLISEGKARPGQYCSWSCSLCNGWHVTRRRH